MTLYPHGYFEPAEPAVRLEDDGRTLVLLEPLRYTTPGGVTHTAEAGFRSDGSSKPRFLWWLIGSPWTGRDRLPAVIHDKLCRQARAMGGNAGWRLRQYADDLFGLMNLAAGNKEYRAAYLKAGVRIGAWAERARGVYR